MPKAFDLNRNHFDLFGIEPRFAVDLPALDSAYRDLQSQVHPDKYAHLSSAEQRAALQWATHVNGAYQTLKSPLFRARYLIELAGIETGEAANRALPAAFLMEQMEWREAVEAARAGGDAATLAVLDRDSATAIRQRHLELEQALDVEHDAGSAQRALVHLMFLDKLREEIGDALDSIATA